MFKISDLLDCKLRNFIIIIFSIEISLLSSMFMDILNFNFPILRQILGFIYLTFIPGIILLRLFKLNIKLPEIELFMYAVGLSITFTMFVGFFINKLTWLNFISLSTYPYMYISLSILSCLCLLCCINEKNISHDRMDLDFKCLFSNEFLFLILIPLIAILGAYLVNFYHSNILLIIFILFSILTVFFVVYDKFIPKNLYPFAIFMISISILYHNSLSSTYLDGYDIHFEYYFANLVKLNGVWDSNIYENVNGMLSIIMLAPIYSEICNLELTWVFKIIYPFFFSLISLGIYHIYNKQIHNETISFLSVFYFISIITYFTEMLALARQQIAEFFLILIIMLMNSDLELNKKRLLIILCISSLVTSHYGLSYLVLFFSILGYLFMVYVLKQSSKAFYPNILLIFFVFLFLWYYSTTSGSSIDSIVHIIENMHNMFKEDFLNSRAVYLATSKSVYISDQILKIMFILTQIFIFFGYIKVNLDKNKCYFSIEFLSFSFMFMSVLLGSIVTNSTGMNIHRLYHITSLVLSLFCVIGCVSLLQIFEHICKVKKINLQSLKFIKQLFQSKYPAESLDKNLRLVAIFLIIFMLFNIGLPQEIIKDHPTSRSLNKELILNSENNITKNEFYDAHYPDQDIIGVEWLARIRNTNLDICATFSSSRILCSYGMIPFEQIRTNYIKEVNPYYIYLRYPDVHYGTFEYSLSDVSRKNLIYCSKDNMVYL